MRIAKGMNNIFTYKANKKKNKPTRKTKQEPTLLLAFVLLVCIKHDIIICIIEQNDQHHQI